MSGRKQNREYGKLAVGIACGGILLAGLAAGRRWHPAANATGTSRLETTRPPSARAAHASFTLAPQPLAISRPTKLAPAPEAGASALRPAAPSSLTKLAASRAQAVKMYAALPMTFEANNGQTDPRVKFLSRAPGYTLFLTDREAVLSLPVGSAGSSSARTRQQSPRSPSPHLKAPEAPKLARVVRLKFAGGATPVAIAGSDPLPGKTNYFLGNDPKQWRTNVPNYAEVEYRGIYPGVNATFHGDNRQLEFDFDVAPGADASAIALEIQGARGVRVNRAGDVVLEMDARRDVVLGKPHVYQQSPEGRREIAGNFVMRGRNRVGFSVAAYDHSQPLVIDPTLAYSTYLGGNVEDAPLAIAADSSGSAYITGWTFSADFPVTTGAYQTACLPSSNGACKNQTAFVSKLSPDGSSLVYSTFLNGQTGADLAESIAVDSSGDAVILGEELGEMDFPTTAGVIQATCNTVVNRQQEVFVAKLNPSGSGLVYSTCLQNSTPNQFTGNTGETFAGGIALDGDGNAYVAGTTSEPLEFPTTPGAFQTTCEVQPGGDCDAEYDPFVVKIDPTGENLLYSTFLTLGAPPTAVSPTGIAVDSLGNAYVIGDSDGYSLITTPGSLYPVCPSSLGPTSCNGFVLKLKSDATALVYSTYLGGSDYANPIAVAVDQNGQAYVAGYTESTDFPTTAGVLQYYFTPTGSATTNLEDGFVVKLTAWWQWYFDTAFSRRPDKAMEPGEETVVNIDKENVRILCMGRAHSLNDCIVYFENRKLLMTGDLIWEHKHPVLIGSDITLWRRVLKILENKYEFRTLVPGHGDFTGKNAVIEMEEYFNLIAAAVGDKHKLRELREKYKDYDKFPVFSGVDRVASMIKRENAHRPPLELRS